jgi:hypothetical protein
MFHCAGSCARSRAETGSRHRTTTCDLPAQERENSANVIGAAGRCVTARRVFVLGGSYWAIDAVKAGLMQVRNAQPEGVCNA